MRLYFKQTFRTTCDGCGAEVEGCKPINCCDCQKKRAEQVKIVCHPPNDKDRDAMTAEQMLHCDEEMAHILRINQA